ncbi:MAG: HEAT repeat domain-containing protein [Elusimicrobia bacterium]|nr:HEAT repeat domain-containing protein [Elusimicrobiota bacterium]
MIKASLAGLFFVVALPAVSRAGVFSTASLQGFDIYRSQVVTEPYVRQKYGALLHEYVLLRTDGRSSFSRRARTLKDKIEVELKEDGKLAFANLYYMDYWTTAGRAAYITFDLVDGVDAKDRVKFKAAPTGTPADPQGLLAAWSRYKELGRSLQFSAQLGLARPSCPAFYCTYGSATPELSEFEKKFVSEVPGVKEQLREVLNTDAVPERRAMAMYLLSYLSDGNEVVEIAFKTVSDPDAGVRGAALQVLSDITTYHKDIPIEPSRLFPILDFPSTTDRSKALGVLIGLADNPVYEESLKKNPPPRIVELLKMRQPVIHDAAFAFLVLLTKESYSRKDFAAWEKWLAYPPKPKKKK